MSDLPERPFSSATRGMGLLPASAKAALCAIALILTLSTWRSAGAAGAASFWRRNVLLASGPFASSKVTALAAQGRRIWVGTDKELCSTVNNGRSWDRAKLEAAEPLRGSESGAIAPAEANYITSILVSGGNVWVGTRAGLFVSSGGKWYLYGEGRGLASGGVWSAAGEGDHLWLAGEAGVFESDSLGGAWRAVAVPRDLVASTSGAFPPGRQFTCVAVSEHAAWLGPPQLRQVAGKGFCLLKYTFDGGKWERVWFGGDLQMSDVPLTLNRIRAFGREVWLGTSMGVFVGDDEGTGAWRHYASGQKLAGDLALDILRVGKRVWVATGNGLSCTENEGQSWTSDDSPRGNMTCLAVDSIALWVGTEGGALRRLAGGRHWESFASTVDVHGVAVQTVEKMTRWWVATSGGVCVSSDDGESWHVFTVSDGLPSNVVNGIAVDDENLDVWVATDGGVARRTIDEETWRRYGLNNGLLSAHVSSIAVSHGTVWAATGRGLSRLDKDAHEFRTFRQLQEWDCVAFDGDTLLAAGMDWTPRDLQEYAKESLEPLGSPLFRFVVLDRERGWQNLTLDGYRGGFVHNVAIYDRAFWVLSDAGLFHSRDGGLTWARYSTDSLWAPSAMCMGLFPDGGLMVQSALRNPPGPYGAWSVTKTDGQDWLTLKPRLPALVTSATKAVSTTRGTSTAKTSALTVAGGPSGLFVLKDVDGDMLAPERPGWMAERPGWMAFNTMAFLASSSHGGPLLAAARFDPFGFHSPVLWVGTRGGGVMERCFPQGEIIFQAPAQPDGGAQPEGRGPLSDNILCVDPEPEAVWFGTDKGVSAFNRMDLWRSFPPATEGQPGLRGNEVRGVARLGDEMWFGTEAGCSQLNLQTGAWRFVNPTNPPASVSCLETQGGVLWVGTRNGLYRFAPPDKWENVVRGADVFCMTPGRNLLCAGTDRGFYAVDKDGNVVERLDHDNSMLPTDRIDRIVLDGQDIWANAGGAFVRLNLVADVGGETYQAPESERGPAGVLVVINQNSPGSARVGEYYAQARHIPPENICTIQCPTDETISREVFDHDIRWPIARHLLRNDLSRRISFIVTTYGVPLRIAAGVPIADAASSAQTDRACVDSELCLLTEQHALEGPITNLYLNRGEPFSSTKLGIYLVTRLDGPTPDAAIQMVDRAITAERDRSMGAMGWAYFEPGPMNEEEYPRERDAINENQRKLTHSVEPMRMREESKDRVVVQSQLEQRPHETFDAFFYMGWPSEEGPRPQFTWNDGAVAVVMAPLSCGSLHEPQTGKSSWCAAGIREGLTGAVGSCYNGTPMSWTGSRHLFLYMTRGYCWAETCYMSLRYLSWDQVVLGDPLYRPFR